MQFNRYMSGYSFPKPNVLEKICNYFQVDARIILEELTDEQMELVTMEKMPEVPELKAAICTMR